MNSMRRRRGAAGRFEPADRGDRLPSTDPSYPFERVVEMPGCTSRKVILVRLCGALVLALGLAGAAVPAAAQSIGSRYTDYDTKLCPHKAGRAVEDYGEWRCKGADGIAMRASAGDQRMTMSFGPHAKDEPAAGETLQGFNDVYKARIEWRFARAAGGRTPPFAAIVRWNTFLLDESGELAETGRPKTISGQVLVVTRLGPRGVCHVGYVDALANRDANDLARRIADERARAFRCGTDTPIILGETGAGFSSSGKAEKVEQ
jgi:hypothetical protein